MMIFSIYDEKAEVYNTPFFQGTVGMALRSFQELVRDNESMLFKYPEDYILYCIGEYDEKTGEITANIPPAFIARATEYTPKKPTNEA